MDDTGKFNQVLPDDLSVSLRYADVGSPKIFSGGKLDDVIQNRTKALDDQLKKSNPGMNAQQRKSLIDKDINQQLQKPAVQDAIAQGNAAAIVNNAAPPSGAVANVAPNPVQVADDAARIQSEINSLKTSLDDGKAISQATINSLTDNINTLQQANVRLTQAVEKLQNSIVALRSKPLEQQVTTVAQNLDEKLSNAVSKGSVGTRVWEWTKRNKFRLLAAGTFGAVVGWAATAAARAQAANEALIASLGDVAAEHQKDLNGCFLYDRAKGTKTKIALLTCNNATLTNAIETCLTQSYTAGGSALNECSDTTFNPCIKDSTNRSGSGPLVPDACSKYLYKGTKPADVSGVTTIDACRTAGGAVLGKDQSCSIYCKTENFDLPPMIDLLCVSVDLPTAFVDLLSKLDIDPKTVYPPNPPPPPPAAGFWSQPASKPLMITAGILGGCVIVLLAVYLFRKKSSPPL
jgi:hypothetical protein